MATKSGWTVEYVSKAVEKEMLIQHKSIKVDFLRIKHTIETEGLDAVSHKLKEKIGKNLWEMRLTGEKVIARALYLRKIGSRVIIVCVFKKDTPKIEHRYIQLALKRAKEFENAQTR
ncbi:MAG: type II toxin-antitoxin system RelE/ParE family toxin [Proteobacteria bacterium]|nr:type II toxin-antitoxin system RelE/ParE family toxin [Pseudomonadota bacterium]